MKNWRDDSALKIRGSTAWAIFGSDSHLTLEQLKCLELLYSDWRICVTCLLKTVWQVWCHGQRSRKRRWENSALKRIGPTGEIFVVKNWLWNNLLWEEEILQGRNRCGLSTFHSMASLTVCKPTLKFPKIALQIFWHTQGRHTVHSMASLTPSQCASLP